MNKPLLARRVSSAIAFAGLLVFPAIDSSQVEAAPLGTAFTYQGRLQDGGSPGNGLYDLQFTVFDSASGGSPVSATGTLSAVGVTNGLFTVSLDFGAAVFDGSARWLELGERRTGDSTFTILTPRQRLAPAPYALYATSAGAAVTANTASTASGVAAGSVGSAGLANNAVSAAKLASDAGSLARVSGGVMTSSGTSFTLATNGYLADHDLFLREDALHGLGWFGNPKYFAGVNVNGPVLYGNGGGALGARGATTNIALQWDAARNVTMPGTLNVSGTVTATSFSGSGSGLTGITVGSGSVTAAKLANDPASLAKVTGGKMSMTGGAVFVETDEYFDDYDIYLRNDFYHGLGWYGDTKLFAGVNVNGPVLYGYGGGALGVDSGTRSLALQWKGDGRVVIDPGTKNTGNLLPGLIFGGSGSGEGIASKRDAGGNQFGLDLYSGFQPRLSISQAGDVALNDNGLRLRGVADVNHGLKYGLEGWGVNSLYDGPVLHGYTGGVLGTKLGSYDGTPIHTNSWSLLWTYFGTVWARSTVYQGSDRAIKSQFADVNCKEVLEKVAALPLQTWRYKAEEPGARHLGPVSQDFYAAFGLGANDKYIATVDANGVALAAIQGLNQKLEAEVKQKNARIEALEQTVAELKALVSTLATKVNGAGQ